MKSALLYIFLLLTSIVNAQVNDSLNTTVEQQLENITENNEDIETEDDSYLQELAQFYKNPVNLNTADETVLKELRLLNAIQIQNFLTYREVLGDIVNIYELQAIPEWDINTILKLK